MELYQVEQIAEGDYGCEELPEGAPVLCSVTLRGPDGASLVLEVPDQALTAQSIQEGCTVLRQDGSLQLVRPIRTSALIGLGALGILFGRKMPGVQVIADSQRAARYTAHPARDLVFKAPGRIQFGERDGRITPRVAAVAQYFAACGIAGEPCTDILYKQWHKLMINVGLNQASAAFGMTYGGLAQDNAQRALMLSAMQEVIRLANAEGVPLPP